MIAVAGCTHKKEGNIVKGADGRIYRLEGRVGNEAYELKEIDTTELRMLNHLP